MGNKKQKLSKVKKNRGNVSSLLNWQTHRIQKTTFPKRTKIIDGPDEKYGAVNELECFVVDKILRDEEFWKNNIEPQCTKFYMESLVPEIIDSRFDRGLPIRSGLPEP
ncbi:Hypothetical protein CINCED_3A005730 [Cinara cedri]|uniref:Uncharacterized protein n=1 Tax=Cinara cedri TaxID=506608 RepID=A0A5E4NRY1_9HEMI|nr:Hypothetical protein CINCED_3A005730 [Cinara cedri]